MEDRVRTDALAPLFIGTWLVKRRRGFNIHIGESKSKKDKVVHINRCEKIPTTLETDFGATTTTSEIAGEDNHDHQLTQYQTGEPVSEYTKREMEILH